MAAVLEAVSWFAWGEDTTFRTFFAIYVFPPIAGIALFLWWTFFSGLSRGVRFAGLALVAIVVGTFFFFVRIDGVDGVMVPILSRRSTPTAEQRAQAFRRQQTPAAPIAAAKVELEEEPGAAIPESPVERIEITQEDWPQFRGPRQDGIVLGATVRTDWDANPPREVWKHPCGLGWSSFAAVGKRLFTQEQIDQDEAVVCYDAETGRELWRHTDRVRLDTSLGGDGPRATPTVFDSRVYSLGGTGILNCLDPLTGKRIWTADILKDAGIESVAADTLDWGISGSPYVDDERVYVNPGISRGAGGSSAVIAYDRLTGKKLWGSGDTPAGYAMPLGVTIDGVRQIVVFDAAECAGYDRASGRKLWQQPWSNNQKINVAQPIPVGDHSFVISSGYAAGAMRFDVTHSGDDWAATETWRLKNQFKLKFNDGVLRDGVIYGLDEGILACLDVSTGERKWRQGRYRYGEILLVAGATSAEDVLVVLTETGDVVLVRVTPEKPVELGRFKAISGTCWNHPVIHRGRLYVRSEQEMACFDVGRPADTKASESQ